MDMGLNQKQYIIKGMTHRMGLHLVIYQFRLHSVCKLTPIPKKKKNKHHNLYKLLSRHSEFNSPTGPLNVEVACIWWFTDMCACL